MIRGIHIRKQKKNATLNLVHVKDNNSLCKELYFRVPSAGLYTRSQTTPTFQSNMENGLDGASLLARTRWSFTVAGTRELLKVHTHHAVSRRCWCGLGATRRGRL
jgi:hypothetical protein